MTENSGWRSSEPVWGYHDNRSAGRSGQEDLRPPVMRFAYQDRLAEEEADARAVVAQRVEAAREGLPPVAPEREHQARGVRYAVYSGEGAREMRRRAAGAARPREGGR